MHRILLGLTLVVGTGCGKKEESKPTPPPAAKSAEVAPAKEVAAAPAKAVAAGPAVGDTVVALWSGTSYWEGKVVSIEPTTIKVGWADGSTPSDIAKANVYAMPSAGSSTSVKQGDIVAVKPASGTAWQNAEVTGVEGGSVRVKVIGSSTEEVKSQFIAVPAETANTIREQAKQAAERNAFMTAAKAAGAATAPKGWKPKAGAKVVAIWAADSYYAGTVESVAGDKVKVAWADGSKPSDADLAKVVPMPTGKGAKMPPLDAYLIVKGSSDTAPWTYAKVVKANADSIDVVTVDGATKTISAADFLVLK